MRHLILILFLSIFYSCNHTLEGQVISKGKKYSFSSNPNYPGTDGNDLSDLTDGTKKLGLRFWQDKSTVGWRDKKEIEIDIDLGSLYSIEGLLINTARNSKAEVEFPMSALIFTSYDNKEFEYNGDLMMTADNIAGEYKVKSFLLKDFSTIGRYIKLVITTKSKFVFLDEIEVYGKKSGEAVLSRQSKDNIPRIQKDELSSFINRVLNESTDARTNNMKIDAVKRFLGSTAVNLAKKPVTASDLYTEQKKIIAKYLPKRFVFTSIKDLNVLNSFNLDSVISAHKSNKEVTIRDGVAFFSIINNNGIEDNIYFKLSNDSHLKIYEVLPVAVLNKKTVNDALKPIKDNKILIQSGENKLFVLLNTARDKNGDLNILSSIDDSVVGKVSLKGLNLSKNNNNLNVNVWSYLDKPVLKNNKSTVVDDLQNSGVNVIVAHSGFIDAYTSKDFSKLKSYLKQFKDLKNKKILLFYNFKSNPVKLFNGQKFLDEAWKTNFKKWYTLMQNELSSIGVNVDQIYFYPYDEIKTNEIQSFIQLAKWGKTNLPHFKTFLTIIDQKAFEAASYADVVQLTRNLVTKASEAKNAEVWMYDVLDNSRERHAYRDYRMMSWIAYYYNLRGVGFWNYSALENEKDAHYDSAINGNKDYSVLYIDIDGSPLPSLRWKYFVQGVYDYNILVAGEKKYGKEKIKKMVKRVIDNSDKVELAEETLQQLSDIK